MPKAAAVQEPKSALIFIPKIEEVHTEIELESISPLIVHAWSDKAKKMMLDKQMGNAKTKKAFKDPQEDFNSSRYLNAEGKDSFPVLAFKSAAVEAGVICDVYKTTLRKAFFVGEAGADLIPLIIDEPPIMREDMVRIAMGTADIRFRAEYKRWGVKVPVSFNPRIITAEVLYNLFNVAGYSIGVGEWRPEKDGQFGRFRVKV